MTENKSSARYTFGKEEKLCSEKVIEKLFSRGTSFVAYPLRVVYLLEKEDVAERYTNKVLISVPKRRFKRANKRNRIKRLIREVYRLNKHSLIRITEEKKVSSNIAFLYLKDELPSFGEIEKAMLKTINLLEKNMKEEKDEKTID